MAGYRSRSYSASSFAVIPQRGRLGNRPQCSALALKSRELGVVSAKRPISVAPVSVNHSGSVDGLGEQKTRNWL
jgi:hypothetical protein